MNALNIALVAIGGLVLFLGLISNWLRRAWWASDPIIALLFGILLGPTLGVLNPLEWGISQEVLVEQAARFTLAIGLMGVALRLPKNYVFRHWRSLSVLLGLVMPLMWLSSGLIVYFILNLPFWEAMLIGAVVSPTDPIVASSIVTGCVAQKYLPSRLRHLISSESGANDGLAYPIVFLPLLLLTKPPGAALSEWLVRVILWEVGGAILVGILLGYGSGRLLEWAEAKQTIEEYSFLSYAIALTLTVLGTAKLIGSDGILAVFVAGLAFSEALSGKERSEEENIQEAINRFFSLPIFILLGLVIPWQQWQALGWRGLALAVAVLLLRRLPAILMLKSLLKLRFVESVYVGWFGPIGVAALYYASLSVRETGVEEIWGVSSLLICASIFAHGFTSTPLTEFYGKFRRNRA